MARVAFTANLQRHIECPLQSAPGRSVRVVLEHVFAAQPRLRSYILDDQDRVRKHVAIYVNSEPIDGLGGLATSLKDGDEVAIIPALAGGIR